jgi:hypothetical protein
MKLNAILAALRMTGFALTKVKKVRGGERE